MRSAEQYLKPAVIQNIARLDLRAKFIVEGLLSGLHNSPFQGFSVEFSEHRRYEPGDDPRDIDWQVFARTDRIYIRRYPGRNQHHWLPADGSLTQHGLHLSANAHKI